MLTVICNSVYYWSICKLQYCLFPHSLQATCFLVCLSFPILPNPAEQMCQGMLNVHVHVLTGLSVKGGRYKVFVSEYMLSYDIGVLV